MRLALAALLVLVALGRPATAAEPTDSQRLAALEARVKAWCGLRVDSFYVCPTCKGRGRAVYLVGGNARQEMRCYDCAGNGWRFREEKARNAWLSYRSPAGRVAYAAEYERWMGTAKADPRSSSVRSCSLTKTRLIGARYGGATVVSVGVAAGREEREFPWIYLPGADGKPQWFLWTDGADPAWESEPEIPRVPLSNPERDDVAKMVAVAGVKSAVLVVGLEGKTLVVELLPTATDQAALDSAARADVVAAAKAGMLYGACDAVRIDFQARYRDGDGNVSSALYRSYGIQRERWKAIRWENLSQTERLSKFKVTEPKPRPEGTVLWWKE